MKIYTSYFANIKNLIKDDILPISISRVTPKWAKVDELKELSPRYEMLRMSEENYIVEFDKILKRKNPHQILNIIKQFGILSKKNVALLCYEKPGDFCHRHIVAQWLNKNTEAEVYEWVKKEKPKAQYTIF